MGHALLAAHRRSLGSRRQSDALAKTQQPVRTKPSKPDRPTGTSRRYNPSLCPGCFGAPGALWQRSWCCSYKKGICQIPIRALMLTATDALGQAHLMRSWHGGHADFSGSSEGCTCMMTWHHHRQHLPRHAVLLNSTIDEWDYGLRFPILCAC